MSTKRENNRFIVLYHKSPEETIKMTKASPYGPAMRSLRSFARIGISPCEVVEIKRSAKKTKTKKVKG